MGGHVLAVRWADWLAVAGVTLFFVLSGYLITGRLQAGLPIGRFFANRARRLLPALLLMLAVTGPWFVLEARATWWQVVEPALYLRDITVAHFGAPLSPWSHTWSLGIEEQFYLLWPFALLAWRRPRRAVVLVGSVSLVAMLVAFAAGDVELARCSPLTQAWALCLGCWLALSGWSPRWPGWISMAWLRWFGVRSYAMYLWHFPLMFELHNWMPDRVGFLLACTVSVGISALSWQYVEEPWLSRARISKWPITQPVQRLEVALYESAPPAA